MVNPSSTPSVDDLTRALTRASGENLLTRALRGSQSVAVLFVDIDHFKSINDAFGHEAGDHALRFVAEQLRNAVGEEGYVARYGGDEFFAVIPGASISHGQKIAERVLSNLSGKVVSRAYPLHLRLSIGISQFPNDGVTVEALLRVADRRHYFAKQSGGHRAVATDRLVTRELITVPRRPIGQRQQLAELQTYLSKLLHHRSGVIRIQSPPYGGAEGFLDIARSIAKLQGYVVVPVYPLLSRRLRYLGAMSDAVARLLHARGYQIPPLETPMQIQNALRTVVEASSQSQGVFFTVENSGWLDEASVKLLQHLLNLSEVFPHVGLVYATVGATPIRFRAPMYESLTLPPLDFYETEAWLRHALRWEPPKALIEQMQAWTDGRPGLIHTVLITLIHEGFLQPSPGGWLWIPPQGWEPPRPSYGVFPDVGVPPNLPLLFGCNRDMWLLQDALKRTAFITVTGVDGAGKSRLLQQLALESADSFPDGVHYISLEADATGHFVDILAQRLRLPLVGEGDLLTRAAAYMRTHRALILIDGVEHFPQATEVLEQLLSLAPQSRIVVGSRQRLQLPFGLEWLLTGLSTEALPGEHSPAASLFAHASRQGGAPPLESPEDWEKAERICRQVNGLPLAVQIVASWRNTLTQDQILKALQQKHAAMNPLDAALDAFWDSLATDEQRRVALLSLLEGAFSIDAASFIADASPFFLDALLVKAYLSRREDGRFYLHNLLRRYAHHHLQDFPQAVSRGKQRYAEWFLKRLPETHGVASEAERWSFLAPEEDLPNVVKAWKWALQQRDLQLLILSALWVFPSLGELHRFRETHTLLKNSLARLRAWPLRLRDDVYFVLRAYLETVLAEFHYHLGEYAEAAHLLDRLLYRAFPFLPLFYQAYLKRVWGRVHVALGNYNEAVDALEYASNVYQHLHADSLALAVLNALGVAAYGERDLDRAASFFSRALELSQKVSRPKSTAALLNNLGNIAWERQHYRQAVQFLEQALDLLENEGAPNLQAAVLDSMARVQAALENYRKALQYLDKALHLALSCSASPQVLIALTTLARTWVAMGYPQEAADLLATVLAHGALSNYDRREALALQKGLPPGTAWGETCLDTVVQRALSISHRLLVAKSFSPA